MGSDYIMAFYGGALIALSSSLNYILFGNITGLSGILNIVLSLKPISVYFFRLNFVVGLITAVDYLSSSYNEKVSADDNLSITGWMLGGLLIGLGARWSGGCTSGHGVCGLPRFSIPSFVAICIFMPTGIITATYLNSYPLFLASNALSPEFISYYKIISKAILKILQIGCIGSSIYYSLYNQDPFKKIEASINFILGGIFGSGLFLSGMCSRNKILAFLTLSANWDPSLLVVMFTAVFINLFTFQGTILYGKSLIGASPAMPSRTLGLGNFVGPMLFGLGWGITGLCPGPALGNFTVNPHSLLLILTIYSGQRIVDTSNEYHKKQPKKN
jgi:uncharacterized protein